MPSWFCQHLFVAFGFPCPPAEGFLFPFFQSLFSYSWLSENKARKHSIPSVPFWTSSSSIAKRRLYLVTRSPRERPPNLINRTPSPTARSTRLPSEDSPSALPKMAMYFLPAGRGILCSFRGYRNNEHIDEPLRPKYTTSQRFKTLLERVSYLTT